MGEINEQYRFHQLIKSATNFLPALSLIVICHPQTRQVMSGGDSAESLVIFGVIGGEFHFFPR
ncbi:MAG: hypothetical protein ACK5JR_09145 [Tropicimonas sp.]|uniref:hypothetical protein n=1 Tax=Tropicimonas sp. TaxID=2067044 RepID=UPI003A8BEF81